MERLEKLLEWGGTRRDVAFLVLSGLALALELAGVALPISPAWVAIVLCGGPIVLEAFIGLVTRFDIKADLLVSIALIASVLIGELFAAGEIAVIMQLGGLLEELTVAKARAGIEKLVQLTPRTARIVEGDRERTVDAREVAVGQRIRVLPGETVPVDGVLVSGATSVNQAVMTGESLPVDKAVGDEVSSGTVNQFGSFDMTALRVGEDSSLQRMIRLVQSADAGKAKIVTTADRWATWIVVAALTAALLTWLFTGELLRSVTILVVFCPCALVLATPTAMMAAMGNATRHGFLIREGDALERLSQVSCLTFDKTGTLTRGVPQVVEVRSLRPDLSQQELLALTASAEQRSEHPLGRAVIRDCSAPLFQPEDFAMVPGKGVSAQVHGRRILAGNQALLTENDISADALLSAAASALDRGCTLILVALDGEAAGFLALADTPRPDAAQVVRKLRDLSLRPLLLTGDHAAAAAHTAQALSIPEFRADCLPEDKLACIDELQGQGARLCMMGDGVNDAPALKRAHVGIAMGGSGSDIAVDAADITLVQDDLSQLPHLLALSRRMMGTIRRNLAFSLGLNFLAIALAITGLLDPVAGALVHNAGSVLVIIQSALLLRWQA